MTVFTRRDILRLGLAAAAAGASATWVGTGPSSAATSSAPFRAYSRNSYFKSSVTGAPITPGRTEEFRSFMMTHPDQVDCPHPVINGIGGNAWGVAHAMGTAAHPVWTLTGGNIPAVCSDLRTVGFRAPAWFGDMFSGTSDSPFVVIDTGMGQSVWAAGARVAGDRVISVSAAGRFKHDTNGLDRRNPRSNGPKNERSRGAVPDAMVIRRDLVDHGIANDTDLGHVLHLFLVETSTEHGFCHPMTGAESGKAGFGAEGERIAIDGSVDLTSRGLSPGGLVVARTLQNYGCYLGDNSGSGTALKAEQENESRQVWGGVLNRDSLEGITWDDFVVLRRP